MIIPLIFIFIAALVVLLLVYWITSTDRADSNLILEPGRFNYEIAPELAANGSDEFYLAQNTIKFQFNNDGYGLAFWNLGRAKWEEVCTENGIKADMRQLVLRLTEIGDRVNNSDMWVMTTAGQYRFKPQSQHSYYLSLGIKHNQLFIPILTSSTIMLHR